MLDIQKLEEVRGNNVVIYSIKTLLEKNAFPRFVILAGHMGVGKSTVARLVAEQINAGEFQVVTFNFGLKLDLKAMEYAVFKMKPSHPRAFIFEEIQGMDKSQQTALLTMLDSQPDNVFILCTTTEVFKILNTIRSRATVWEFKLLGERQLSQLLDDYLSIKSTALSQKAKTALLKSCYGVPRDLLKNTDLAISGDFSAEQLEELLGHVSEDLIFTVFCALKSSSVDFSTHISAMIDDSGKDKLKQFRDFFTRYLLERKGIEGGTIGSSKIKTLDGLFSDEEIIRIGNTLVKANGDTLALELAILNLEFTRTGMKQLVGQQIDRSVAGRSATPQTVRENAVDRKTSSKISASSLNTLKFTDA